MRDIFTEIFENQPIDPTESARRGLRMQRRARFYSQAEVGEAGQILLDGKPVRTPARRLLAVPGRPLAEAIAAEWQAQRNTIDPAAMPLTRLANAIIDGVADAAGPVAAEIEQYLGSDLVLYRAPGPAGLLAAQARHWDPVVAWVRDTLGARFVLAEGVVYVAQPAGAVAAAARAIPTDMADPKNLWRLGAISAVTTLTGSALIALALAHGALTADEAWAAAHVDEDWNRSQWGSDEAEDERRAFRRHEMDAAAAVLRLAS